MLEIRRSLPKISKNTTPHVDRKSPLAALFCLQLVVMPADSILSSKGYLYCVEHNAGEPMLPNTALEKPLTKLLSSGGSALGPLPELLADAWPANR